MQNQLFWSQETISWLTYLTVVSFPAVTTDALVHADFIYAGASIVARVALTVIDVWNG